MRSLTRENGNEGKYAQPDQGIKKGLSKEKCV